MTEFVIGFLLAMCGLALLVLVSALTIIAVDIAIEIVKGWF